MQKLSTIPIWSFVFSRDSSRLPVYTLNFHWLITICLSLFWSIVVIIMIWVFRCSNQNFSNALLRMWLIWKTCTVIKRSSKTNSSLDSLRFPRLRCLLLNVIEFTLSSFRYLTLFWLTFKIPLAFCFATLNRKAPSFQWTYLKPSRHPFVPVTGENTRSGNKHLWAYSPSF